MPLVPIDWSVIIAGRWNCAILTPQGIGQRLFDQPPGTPLVVEVPIDSLGPYRVTHEGITVSTTGLHLLIQPEQCNYVLLERAMTIGDKALSSLPETPLSAVGINIRYKCAQPLGVVAQVTSHSWDDELSDADFEIQSKTLMRSIRWNKGSVNFTAQDENGEFTLQFNLERKSAAKDDHSEWLRQPIGNLRELVDGILLNQLQIRAEDLGNG